MKSREYKHFDKCTPKTSANFIRLFCNHHFVAHRLDEFLFPDSKSDLYITCNKCGTQYICKKFFNE